MLDLEKTPREEPLKIQEAQCNKFISKNEHASATRYQINVADKKLKNMTIAIIAIGAIIFLKGLFQIFSPGIELIKSISGTEEGNSSILYLFTYVQYCVLHLVLGAILFGKLNRPTREYSKRLFIFTATVVIVIVFLQSILVIFDDIDFIGKIVLSTIYFTFAPILLLIVHTYWKVCQEHNILCIYSKVQDLKGQSSLLHGQELV
ncbi:unnamed protein product [Moneuplotes crassus]|uniref:Uncharacterized protein n=1 Tax=Euplotes crassus TaxID=5936 RepID=A0AAD2CZI1_EUPCR|nr:unnamed protein product [Moneuplotes crassus]